MYTPQGGRAGNRTPDRESGRDRETVGAVEYYMCGLAGLLVTAAVALLLYPVLVVLTSPLYVLSSTALVVILMTVWLVTWLAFELVWEWRAGRLSTDG